MKNISLELATAVALSSALLLTACGGSSGSSGDTKADTPKPTTPTNPSNPSSGGSQGSTNGLANLDSTFSKCSVANSSEDPAHLSCLTKTYTGVNPAGKACSLEFNGDTLNAKFTLDGKSYKFTKDGYKWSLYSRMNNNGKLMLLETSVHYTKKKFGNSVGITISQSENVANKIEVEHNDKPMSCSIKSIS